MDIKEEIERNIGKSVLEIARLSEQAEKWIEALPNTHMLASEIEAIKLRWYQKKIRDEQNRINRLVEAQLAYETDGTDRLMTILSMRS